MLYFVKYGDENGDKPNLINITTTIFFQNQMEKKEMVNYGEHTFLQAS